MGGGGFRQNQLTMAPSGIGLETSILFAKEGAKVLMADISAPALEKALQKVKSLVPEAARVETTVSRFCLPVLSSPYFFFFFFCASPSS